MGSRPPPAQIAHSHLRSAMGRCTSGLDHLKTDEYWPIEAYRAFYVVDKMKFARYNKGRDMPYWMKGATQ